MQRYVATGHHPRQHKESHLDHSNSKKKREVSDTHAHILRYAQTIQLAWMLTSPRFDDEQATQYLVNKGLSDGCAAVSQGGEGGEGGFACHVHGSELSEQQGLQPMQASEAA